MKLCEGRVHYGIGSNRREAPCNRHAYRQIDGRWFCFHHADVERARLAIEALHKIAEIVRSLNEEELEGAPGQATGQAILALERLNEPLDF
jgi:hypothetical protein